MTDCQSFTIEEFWRWKLTNASSIDIAVPRLWRPRRARALWTGGVVRLVLIEQCHIVYLCLDGVRQDVALGSIGIELQGVFGK